VAGKVEIGFIPAARAPEGIIAKTSLHEFKPQKENPAIVDIEKGLHDTEVIETPVSGAVVDELNTVVSSSHESPDLYDECKTKCTRLSGVTQDESARDASSSPTSEIMDFLESTQKLCNSEATNNVEAASGKLRSIHSCYES
jgi:hypothetical protein